MKPHTLSNQRFSLALRWQILVAVGLLFTFAGCWTTRKDVSQQKTYKDLVGTTWRLKQGLYIVEYVDGSGKPGQLATASHATQGKETVVDEDNVGKTFLDTIIKGVLPNGTEIRVLSVIEIDSFEGYDSFDIMVRPTGELGDKWLKLEGGDIEETGWINAVETGKKEFQVKMNTELVEQDK